MTGSWTSLRRETNSFLVYGITRRATCNKEFTGQGVKFRSTSSLKKSDDPSEIESRCDETVVTDLVVQATTHSTVSATVLV